MTDTTARTSVGPYTISAADLPGLFFHVAPDGAILSLSWDLAETLGADDPASLRGRPIATFLPAVAPGTPLLHEIHEMGEIRNASVRLLAPADGIWSMALLSARAETGNGMAPGAWMGCLTLPSAEDQRSSSPVGVYRELLDGMQVELRSELEVLSLQFPHNGGSDASNSVRSLVRMFLVILPRLEAILALDTPCTPQVFDARASISELCRASGRLLDSAGVSLVFDADPAIPTRVSTDENRLRTCLNLLLGAVSTTEHPAEIMVRLAFEDAGFLSIEVVVSPAAGRPALSAPRISEFELSQTLAATADGVVSVDLQSPDCTKYVLRMKVPAASESEAANAPDAAAKAIDRALQGLRILFVGLGEGQRTVFAKWIERQHAGFVHAAAPWEAQSACSGVRPDIAVLDLSVCQALPEFLREVLILGLRGSLVPLPEWCQTCIEKPVFEEDLLDEIGSLRPRIDPAEWEPRGAAASSTARILAVDDNPMNQRIIQRMLTRLGYEVDLASNGLEALAVLRQRPHDAVLMDWEMPIMDGLETTAAIRELPEPLCRIPIIAVTAHAMEGDRETCLRGGMDDYLSKPVTVDALRRALDIYLPRSPRLLRGE